MSSKTTPNAQRDHIDGHHALRGIAALAVALMHLRLLSGLGLPEFGGVFTFWANEAVDLFFILSGFIFAYVYGTDKPVRWKQFYIARLARLYPVYVASMGLILALDLYI